MSQILKFDFAAHLLPTHCCCKKKFFRLKYKSSNMKFNTFHLAYKSILLLGTRDTKSENSISNIRFVFDTFYFC